MDAPEEQNEPQVEIEREGDDREAQLNQINELRSLYLLHNDTWVPELLEPPFRFYYQRILHPRERQVVDGKIAGKTNKQIGEEMGLEEQSVMRYIYAIRYIFRNKARQRVNKFWNVTRKFSKRNHAWRSK